MEVYIAVLTSWTRKFMRRSFFIFALFVALAPPAQAQDLSDNLRTIHQLRRLRMQSAALQEFASQMTGATSESGSISGRVLGLSARALDSAEIVAWTVDASGQAYWKGAARVARDSTYRIEGLADGEYYVLASADGYESLFYDGARDPGEATTVAVTEASPAVGVDFRMEPFVAGTGAISGRVRASGDPIPFAEVYAYSPADPLLFAYTMTGDDGTYALAELRSGRYIVEVRADGYVPEYFDDAVSYSDATLVEVTEPDGTEGIDFDLSQGGSISGYVTDVDGTPLSGAFIDAMIPAWADSTGRDDGIVWPWLGGWAMTDETGFYRITGLNAGEYVVYAQAWSLWSFSFEWYDDASYLDDAARVPVALGEETAGIDFRLDFSSEKSSISGRVMDEDGEPVSEAFIMAETLFAGPPRSGGYVWAYAVTDRSGRYEIEQLPEGSYRVSASAQLGWEYVHRWYPDAESPDNATPVMVAEDERVENIDFYLPASSGSSSISGIVRSSSGEALPNAYVELTTHSGNRGDSGAWFWAHARTDSVGAYVLGNLPEGSYIVQASYWSADHFGHEWFRGASGPEDATPINLGNDELRIGIDFHLDVRPIYGVVQGTVVDETSGQPLDRAYVELMPFGRDLLTDAPLWSMTMYAVTDEKGRFRLDRVTEGNYILSVYANGAAEYYEDASSPEDATKLHVLGGSETSVDVALSAVENGRSSIAGTVLAEDGSSPPIAVVIAQPVPERSFKGEARYTAVTGRDGSYRLSGLAAGAYYVRTFAPGFIGEFYDDVYTPDGATPVVVDGVSAGVDFRLWPIYYLAPETDAGRIAAVLYGTVFDESGKPVAGATVYVLDASEQPVTSVQSGADGRFEIAGVQPGQYRLFAGKVGFTGGYNGNASSFTDAELIGVHGGRMQVDLVVSSASVTDTEEEPTLPGGIILLGNYPNPFNPETAILVRIGEPSRVRLTVYDMLGAEVAVVVDELFGSGVQTFRWNGRSTSGREVASGLYFYRVESGRDVRTGRMMLLR